MEISWVRESSGWEGSNVHARFTVALQWPPSWIMHSSRKGMDLAGCSSCWRNNAARNLLIGVSQAACELQLLCRMHESWGSVWPSNSYKPETKFKVCLKPWFPNSELIFSFPPLAPTRLVEIPVFPGSCAWLGHCPGFRARETSRGRWRLVFVGISPEWTVICDNPL